MDRDNYDPLPVHDLARSVSASMEDATILRQEAATLKRILGLCKRRGWIPDDRCFSPEDIHLAVPVKLDYDSFGNVTLPLDK